MAVGYVVDYIAPQHFNSCPYCTRSGTGVGPGSSTNTDGCNILLQDVAFLV